ncbi:lysozyme C-like isoform X2 [Sphaerodactylus townsendi]|uniref:lysozyme C-like isoform X2 n=1 Tax=Sphaerodactylus townsendi TaxID=933632 RepID=UPI0020275B0D|nr:lysozyme C-like isoform X2 [Sphaerodactylus townsendi]
MCPGIARAGLGAGMKASLLLLLPPLIACLLLKARGKTFSRCELALMLQHSGLDGYEGYSLADWVCLAYFSSGFNTAKVTHNSDGSSEYGIFQINSRLWCSDSHSTTKDLCDISCRDLLTDEIVDDIDCIKKAVIDSEGLNAWMGWRDHCRGRNLNYWVNTCNL